MLILFLVEFKIKARLSGLRSSEPALWLVGLFLLHVIWLINTQNFEYAFKDLRIKLPLLVLAISLGVYPLKFQELKIVILSLGVGVWIAILVGYFNYFTLDGADISPRIIVPDISHIRLGLMMITLLGLMLWIYKNVSKGWKTIIIVTVVNVLIFLYILQALTAFITLIISVIIVLTSYFLTGVKGSKRIASISVFSIIPVVLFFYLKGTYDDYFILSDDAIPKLPVTEAGNPFNHYSTDQIENGNMVYSNICELELAREWNKRSDSKIGYDPMINIPTIDCLVRYLTSKGLTKDSVGVNSLNDEDIERIESGFPAAIYAESYGLPLRIHSFLHGAHMFFSSGEVQGSSFFQRVVYWNIGLSIAKDYWLFGTGTGDVKDVFLKAYEEYPIDIDPRYRLRAHNQYITFFVTFGIVGLIYFFAGLGIVLHRSVKHPGFFFFFCVAALSFMTEDTLETQAGVTFIAFFTSLFSAYRNGAN